MSASLELYAYDIHLQRVCVCVCVFVCLFVCLLGVISSLPLAASGGELAYLVVRQQSLHCYH